MSVIRNESPDTNYTKVPNALLRKPGFDLQTTALLIYLLSHKKDWIITNSYVAKVWGISPNTVTKMMNKLESAGYLKKQNKTVQANGWDWSVTDTPHKFCGTPSQILGGTSPKNCETPPLKNCEVRKTSKPISNTERNTKKKKVVSVADAMKMVPAGCPADQWEKWIKKRSAGNTIGVRKLENCKNDFVELQKAGLTSWEAAISRAISNDWQSVKPHYFEDLIRSDKKASAQFDGVA